jgi:hypothetical protein
MRPRAQSRLLRDPPWGLAIACGIVALVEGLLRVTNPLGLVPDVADRELEYRSYVTELSARAAPDVAILGSSRAANGVVASRLKDLLAKQGTRVKVGASSLSGARAEETLYAMERARDVSRLPRVWLWALTPLELGGRLEQPSLQATYLWRLPDWWRERHELQARADHYLPGVLVNELGRLSRVVRMRFVVEPNVVEEAGPESWSALRAGFAPDTRAPSFMQGGLHRNHIGKRRFMTRSVTRKAAVRYRDLALRGDSTLDPFQARHLELAARTAADAGVRLIFLELPLSPRFDDVMPAGAEQAFRNLVTNVARRHGFRFVTSEDLDVDLGADDFRDVGHLNFRGATKVTTAVAPVVARELESVRRPRAQPR